MAPGAAGRAEGGAKLAGIVRYGSYVPYFRLQRAALGAGKGERAVASYDEDSVSMAVEAGRAAVPRALTAGTLPFATTPPAHAAKPCTPTLPAGLRRPEPVTPT